ncbi:MAG: hypothetical protein A2504_12630 [Bdellovibrionales bacterium RIFOXYD12_FULL_39_22]|nr:MAG: hypothetical protein A2385_03715 [Bdellovibrionales bacterium RIFOXYB1_FULL_39_21]OFZ40459.1 MAG: hypothetical protein A2485_02580 [Bdellovibrionales bacterium RIFOXYC12_FULL_39_17]OFZ49942.1 MAG: hypothetical protein A2404_01915 [Bdellovibrionales bacterium RIFOXYC1_FULL_39_130]OFZ69654.1 MAG: hypothetical protein A2451_07890 [Bdellovibrionales bacterium RIFOXYC2_FULL_39_8]OFZ77584.1 MAG: hypothetical protein A2560_04475 [Bdellovibrionales bacterium RIFOXYD1_FULL_39_84]OFZ96038.1 MAG:
MNHNTLYKFLLLSILGCQLFLLPSHTNCLANEISTKNIGFILFSPEKQTVLVSQNSEVLFIPGSIVKIATNLMALETLGPAFTFETYLKTNGEIKNGQLDGDLLLESGGDPKFTISNLASMADYLCILGIKKISGNFYYTDGILPTTPILSPESETDQTDNPAVGPLSTEFNRFQIWNQTTPIPPLDFIQIKMSKSPLPGGVAFNYVGDEGHEIWELSPLKKYNLIEELPVRSPGLFSASYLRHLAQINGIVLPTPLKKNDALEKFTKKLFTNSSDPLLLLAESSLEYSNNLIAELILLKAVNEMKKNSGQTFDLSASAKVLNEWVCQLIGSKFCESNFLANGSGLSPLSRTSPLYWIQLLNLAKDKFYAHRSFPSLLSISGKKGWIYRRLNDPEMALRVWAKTGSMDYASSIIGYLNTKSNQRLIFAILISDIERRMHKDYSAKKMPPSWRSEAQTIQDNLLREWFRQY